MSRMVKAVLEHTDSILSYGTEDLAQYKDLPQTTTRIVLGCAGAATNNPYINSAAGYQVGTLVTRSLLSAAINWKPTLEVDKK